MAETTLTLTHGRASDLQIASGEDPRRAAQRFVTLLQGALNGAYAGATGFTVAQTAASGTLEVSGGSGTVGGTINGVASTVTADASDSATAALLAAAINANASALVSGHVLATASGTTVTVAARSPGAVGNAVTLAASGTGVTASAARLTGGTTTTYTF